MAQVLVRDLESEVINRLKERAKFRGRSLEAELRQILQEAAADTDRERVLAVEDIQKMFSGYKFSDSTELLREDRER
jgi:plasmid stability protein